MNKRVLLLLVVAACLGMAHRCSAESEESSVGFEVTADFFSKYVWRGQNLVDDWVFQPGASVSCAGLTASIWGNLELTDETDHKGEFTEVDYALDYSGQVPGVEVLGFSVGVIYYDFPNTDFDGTTEIYWGLSLDVPASPSLTVYRDLDEVEGTYVSAGVAHSVESLLEFGSDMPVGLEASASIGWGDSSYNEGYWGTDGGELNDLVSSLAFPLEIAGVSVTPRVSYIVLLGSDIRDASADDDYFFAGVSLSKSF